MYATASIQATTVRVRFTADARSRQPAARNRTKKTLQRAIH